MTILVDANLWLRSAQPSYTQHTQAAAAAASLRNGGYQLIVVPQVLYEFLVVSTRPVPQNGLGFSAAKTETEMDSILRLCAMYNDDEDIFAIWRELVNKYQIVGKRAHDVRLVAAMYGTALAVC